MATARFFQLYDGGSPPAGFITATPTFVVYADKTGAARTPPTITHVGGGIYTFTPSNDDESIGTLFLILSDALAQPKYLSGAIHLPDNSNQFWAFHFEDGAGGLYAGVGSPTVGQYRQADGLAIAPPTITSYSVALAHVTPAAADIAVGACARIDAPSGASPEFYGLATLSIAAQPAVAPVVSQPSSYTQAQLGTPTAILWKDYQEELAPPWLRTGYGLAWLRGLGDMKDAAEVRLRDSVKLRFPSYTPPDGLSLLSAERGLEQGLTETNTDFRTRVRNAWQLWPWAGTPLGVLRALYYAGFTNAWIVTGNGRLHGLDASQNLVSLVMSPASTLASGWWNGFRIVFPLPLKASWVPTLPLNTSDEVNTIRRLVKQWKAGHALFEDIVVQQTGLMWGIPPTQTWGSGVWGGTITTWTPD